MEPAGGAAHYTETLIRLPNLSVSYRRPEPASEEVPEPIKRLRGEGRAIYLCAQSLFKLLPDQDDLVARIAREVPTSAFVFIAHASDLATSVLRNRLARRLADEGIEADGRIVFLPRLNEASFRAVNKVATVVLDSVEWSGFNSTIEALAAGTPVVAMPGATMRAHHSYGILKMAGLDELIAPDADGYVTLAARLGSDRAFHARMSQLVSERCVRIFDDPAPVTALADWIEGAVKSAG
jgi:predicted O-linked N-acetylglucosamine transferase (SPINDLY family)